MKVTVDDVKKMAALSMLNIDESKLEEFRKNLEAILEHVMKLNDIGIITFMYQQFSGEYIMIMYVWKI